MSGQAKRLWGLDKMSDNVPLVSIITPSYNQRDFIEDNLLSVKSQDYPNIEHIVVDRESTDNTIDIFKNYESKYNLLWISELDEGQSDAVNKGFAMAKGEIIGWLNSDDVYFDTHVITTVVKYFNKNSHIDVIYGDAVVINKDNLIMKVICTKEFDYKDLQKTCFIVQPALFFRRRIIDKHKLDTALSYAMDYEFWLRLAKQYSFRRVDHILAGDRNHERRKIISGRDEMIKETILVSADYCKYHDRGSLLGRIFNVSGRVRTLRGLMKLQSLYSNRDFAFDAKLDGRLSSSLRQLFRPTERCV